MKHSKHLPIRSAAVRTLAAGAGTVLIVWFIQATVTLSSAGRIWPEELYESVTYVYFLSHRLIALRGADRVGWYALLLGVYRLFGMTVTTARYVKLILWLPALGATYALIRNHIGERAALYGVAAIGLSPAVTYVNSLALPVGLEFMYLPLLALAAELISRIRRPGPAAIAWSLFWAAYMTALLSYPTFFLFFPVFLYLYGIRLRRLRLAGTIRSVTAAVIGFLLPLTMSVYTLRNPGLFWETAFRGGGHLDLSLGSVTLNIRGFLINFFVTGHEYISDLPHPDFSGILPLIPLAAVCWLTYRGIFRPQSRQWQRWTAAVVVLILAALAVGIISYDPSYGPGLRRFIPVYLGVYVLYILAWHYIGSAARSSRRTVLMIALAILPLHHVLVLPQNILYLATVPTASTGLYFADGMTPDASLEMSAARLTQNPVVTECRINGADAGCTNIVLQTQYSLHTGYCTWNGLSCKGIYERFPDGRQERLTPEFFLTDTELR